MAWEPTELTVGRVVLPPQEGSGVKPPALAASRPQLRPLLFVAYVYARSGITTHTPANMVLDWQEDLVDRNDLARLREHVKKVIAEKGYPIGFLCITTFHRMERSR